MISHYFLFTLHNNVQMLLAAGKWNNEVSENQKIPVFTRDMLLLCLPYV